MASEKERLYDIIVDKLGVEYNEIHVSSSFKDDLGADSLDAVEIVMEVEAEFGITIPDEKLESVYTVGDALRLIYTYVDGNTTNVVKPESRENNYRKAESLISDNKYGKAKDILLSLTNQVDDAWGMFASYDLLYYAEQFGITEEQKFTIAYSAAITHDYTNSFDETKDFYRCWRDCYNYLGISYLKRSSYEAFKCFSKVAELGLPVGLYNMAYCYHNGIGIKKNFIQALSYYRKAKAAGYESSDLDLAIEQLSEIMSPKANTDTFMQSSKPQAEQNKQKVGHKKLLAFLLGTDLALCISLIGGLSPTLTGGIYLAFLLGFAIYWIYGYYQKNKLCFWGTPDDNGLMRTFFWRKAPYIRVFKTSILFLKSVIAALISILLAVVLSLVLFAILSFVISNGFELEFSVLVTYFLAFKIRKADILLAWGCVIIATCFWVIKWYPDCYIYVGIGLLIGIIAGLKKIKVKIAIAVLPIILYLVSIRFHLIHELIYNTYGTYESGVNVLMESFDNIKVFFLDSFLPYVIIAMVVSTIPLALFLIVASFWLIFAYCLRLYDWVTTHVYSVNHPCPHCQENCEPAVYYSRHPNSNKLLELKTQLRPGLYGLFSIIHPETKQKMPTLLINGRTKQSRKCHHCGEMIFSESGTNKHVAMIGCPGSGKSALCVTMIANMIRNNSNIILGGDVDADTKNIIMKVAQQGRMTNETFPQKTREGRLPSVRVNIPRIGRPDYALYLDDVAGESFDTNKDNTESLNFLYNTTSLIFIIDPFTSKINSPGKMMKKWLEMHREELNPYYNIEDIFSNMRTRINELNRLKKMTINYVLVKTDSGYLDKVNTTREELLKNFIANEMGLSSIVECNEFKASHYYAVTTVFDDGSVSLLNEVILSQQNIN